MGTRNGEEVTPVLRYAFWALPCLAVAFASGAGAQPTNAPCFAPFTKLLGAELFDRYPANLSAKKIKPATPDVRAGDAHFYRTVLREEAKLGPNFAGHYTIARIGCGSATACIAIIDAKTGRVFFPRILHSATALLMDTGSADVDSLNYKLGSHLLIVVGSANEKTRAGMSYYLWRNESLKLIRFTPAASFCPRR